MMKMAQIPNEHHDVLICSQCQKYLSVFPIKVYENSDVKCGRCSIDNDGGVVSLYQKLAENCFFKCINRYDGCRKLLHPSVAAEHEAICMEKTHNCPKCDIDIEMSTYLLVQHFKQSHTDCFLTNNTFYLNITKNITTEKFLLVQDDNIFIILIKYLPNDAYLHISAVTLWEQDVQQRFIISVDDSEFLHTTKKQKCLSIDTFDNVNYYKIDQRNIVNKLVKFEIFLDKCYTLVNTYELQSSAHCRMDDHISTAVKKQNKITSKVETLIESTPELYEHFPDYKLTCSGLALYSTRNNKYIELVCSNCKQILIERVYICEKKEHLLCWDCMVWCRLCKYFNPGVPEDVEAIRKFLLYSCRRNCGTKCNLDDLESHELICEMNKQECPVCHTIFCRESLANHMEIDHQFKLTTEQFLLKSFLENHQNTSKVVEYFIFNDYIFKIKCKRIKLMKKKINNEIQTNFVYNLHIEPCDNLENIELCVIIEDMCHKLENGEITVAIEDNAELYLKYFN